MRRNHSRFWVFCSFVLFVSVMTAQAQNEDKLASNLGGILVVPTGPTSHLVTKNPGITAGVGYNFNDHHSIIGEFFWHELSPSSGALTDIRTSAQDNTIRGHSNLYALTANYRFQMPGPDKFWGAYLIGGGGWYYRTAALVDPDATGAGIPCTRPWLWWDFQCSSGTVVPNQTGKRFNEKAFGGNAGIGVTAKIADPSYRMYLELRYHYAPTKNVNTELMDVTIGVRY